MGGPSKAVRSDRGRRGSQAATSKYGDVCRVDGIARDTPIDLPLLYRRAAGLSTAAAEHAAAPPVV